MYWFKMDSSIDKLGVNEGSEIGVVGVVYYSELILKLVNSKLELVELSLKVGFEMESVGLSFCVSLVLSNLLVLCGRIVVWR